MSKETAEMIDVRDQIMEYLKQDFTSLKRLSNLTGIAYGTIYSCFIERRFSLSEKNLKAINKALGTKFRNTT